MCLRKTRDVIIEFPLMPPWCLASKCVSWCRPDEEFRSCVYTWCYISNVHYDVFSTFSKIVGQTVFHSPSRELSAVALSYICCRIPWGQALTDGNKIIGLIKQSIIYIFYVFIVWGLWYQTPHLHCLTVVRQWRGAGWSIFYDLFMPTGL